MRPNSSGGWIKDEDIRGTRLPDREKSLTRKQALFNQTDGLFKDSSPAIGNGTRQSSFAKRALFNLLLGTLLVAGAAVTTTVFAQIRLADTTPNFGPNVTIFDPSTPDSVIQAKLDSISTESEFSENRHAVFFKPGTYAVNSQVGYYRSE